MHSSGKGDCLSRIQLAATRSSQRGCYHDDRSTSVDGTASWLGRTRTEAPDRVSGAVFPSRNSLVVTVVERVAGIVLTGWPSTTTDRTVKPRNLGGRR